MANGPTVHELIQGCMGVTDRRAGSLYRALALDGCCCGDECQDAREARPISDQAGPQANLRSPRHD